MFVFDIETALFIFIYSLFNATVSKSLCNVEWLGDNDQWTGKVTEKSWVLI